eukprot:382811-Amphidinium_carterae.1
MVACCSTHSPVRVAKARQDSHATHSWLQQLMQARIHLSSSAGHNVLAALAKFGPQRRTHANAMHHPEGGLFLPLIGFCHPVLGKVWCRRAGQGESASMGSKHAGHLPLLASRGTSSLNPSESGLLFTKRTYTTIVCASAHEAARACAHCHQTIGATLQMVLQKTLCTREHLEVSGLSRYGAVAEIERWLQSCITDGWAVDQPL